jgi:hypothetical protein
VVGMISTPHSWVLSRPMTDRVIENFLTRSVDSLTPF